MKQLNISAKEDLNQVKNNAKIKLQKFNTILFQFSKKQHYLRLVKLFQGDLQQAIKFPGKINGNPRMHSPLLVKETELF